MTAKRLSNVKFSFYKTNAEKNGTFLKQIILKDGNKHARIICDTCSKWSIRAQVQCQRFSISTTFNDPRGILIAKF